MHPILAIAAKDLRLLLRDRVAAFFTFGFPLIVALFFGFIFGGAGAGGDDALEVAVWSETSGASDFAKALDDDDAIKVVSVDSAEAGRELVRKGKVVACLELDKTFDPRAVFMGGVQIHGVVDPKRKAEAGLLTGKLNQIAFMQMSKALADPKAVREITNLNRKRLLESSSSPGLKAAFGLLFNSVDTLSDNLAKSGEAKPGEVEPSAGAAPKAFQWSPVTVDLKDMVVAQNGPPNSFTMSFPQGVVWGLMGCVLTFATSFVRERVAGTLARLSVAPISPGMVLAGKAAACFFTCLSVQVFMILVASLPPFNVRVAAPIMLACAIIASSLGFTGLMALIAGLSRSAAAAEGLARAVLIVLALIGGGSIPLMFLPPLVRTLSSISPFKWVTQAWEGALWRDWGFADMALPLSVLIGIGILGYLVGRGVLKNQARS